MSQYDPKKIEEYQLILLKNPRSPVFAALAEAYRKMGLMEEALEVTHKGVKHNPEFVSGLVAHAKVLFELKDYRQAQKALVKAHLLKPENLLALRLLSSCYIKLRKHREALQSFKKLLIFCPNDEAALDFIAKWEFLEHLPANENQSGFEFDDVDEWVRKLPSEQQALHLIDSFMNYGDRVSAEEIANSASLFWPMSEEIKKRHDILAAAKSRENAGSPVSTQELEDIQFKIDFYQRILQRIGKLKGVDPIPLP